MQVVGVDFGTTNVRIATWDSEQPAPPQPQPISVVGDEPIMPAVVALQKQPNGEVAIKVGEEADGLGDEEGVTRVIRDIKRFALSTDEYVHWHLGVRNAHEQDKYENADAKRDAWPPKWWNPSAQRVEEFGREFSIWDLIGEVLTEAFRRANISGDYEWRAGCPVHSDFTYRKGLADALAQVTGKPGNIHWIVEEPFLFLLAARVMGQLQVGSYLVYDVGGGSFDCAVVEVTNRQTQIYGADGHPLLGGWDIDDQLNRDLLKQRYSVQPNQLRLGKETLSRQVPHYELPKQDNEQRDAFITLDYANAPPEVKDLLEGKLVFDVKDALSELRFLEKSVFAVSREAYIGAKSLWWKRPSERIPTSDGYLRYPPVGDVLFKRYKEHSGGGRELREVGFVWQLMLPDLVTDVDGVILCGGPTKSPLFQEYLEERFGTEKVISASTLMPPDLNPELTGASLGACYSAIFSVGYREYTPLYVNRLPLQVTLEDLQTGEKAEYRPFQHFTAPVKELSEPGEETSRKYDPFADFISPQTLSEHPDDPISLNRYELTVTDTDGTVLKRSFVDDQLNTRLMGANRKMVIDRYQRVIVAEWSDKSGVALHPVLIDMPGQTDAQREAYAILQQQEEEDRDYEITRIQAELESHRYEREWGQPSV